MLVPEQEVVSMTDNVDVANFIRFQLDQLASKNGHHDFEHLSRHLARNTIGVNILPATGPVAAGGDQGRDFETFKTELKLAPVVNSQYTCMEPKKTIVFACTIQRNDIEAKIKADVSKAMTGQKFEIMYYFYALDLPVAKRHELQAWARETNSITLEILDGQAISELLAMRELFWIAQRFLGVPSEIYPKSPAKQDWYRKSLEERQQRGKPDIVFADFYEIKSAIRHATFSDEGIKQDIPFWINLLEYFVNEDSSDGLKRRAIYEIAVASLRGLGSLAGQETRLRDYFKDIDKLTEISDLEDAACAVNYCRGALGLQVLNIPFQEIDNWRDSLTKKVDQLLQLANTSSSKSPLLELRGFLAFASDSINSGKINAEEAINWWIQLTIAAKDAPLFPLERFADRLTEFTPYIGDHPKFEYLTQQTDLLLDERYGNIKAAEKCRDRAIAFYEKGRKLKAINQLHQAKVKWFNEETLNASSLSMILIAEWYRELGLCFAGKYYALASAFLCLHSNKPELKKLLPQAIRIAANCDYYQGSWQGFLELTDLWLRVHSYYSGKLDLEDEEVLGVVFYIASLSAITKKIDLQSAEMVNKQIEIWNTSGWLNEPIKMAEDHWGDESIAEIWEKIQPQLIDSPFNDLGTNRQVRWVELGITWIARWTNDSVTTPVAEQLVAILQILLADMAEVDLCLLKSQISLEIVIGQVAEPTIDFLSPTNYNQIWKINLPMSKLSEDIDHIQQHILSVAISILAQTSLLPKAKFLEVIEDTFRKGISMKAFVLRPYEELWRGFMKDSFEYSQRQSVAVPKEGLPFKITETPELAWIDSLGPTYSKEEAEMLLEKRYERSLTPINYTLERLLKSTDFKTLVGKLRTEGWLDWHILGCLANIAATYRVNKKPLTYFNPVLFSSLLQIEMNSPEVSVFSVIPQSEFTEERIRDQLNFMMCSSLKCYGLECRQKVPDFKAIEEFLRVRYRYFADDIPHKDPFIFS